MTINTKSANYDFGLNESQEQNPDAFSLWRRTGLRTAVVRQGGLSAHEPIGIGAPEGGGVAGVRQDEHLAHLARGGRLGRPVRPGRPAAPAAARRLRLHRRGALRVAVVAQLPTLLPAHLQGLRLSRVTLFYVLLPIFT